MNKAEFDRAYKANKGHMLQPVVVKTPSGHILEILSMEYNEITQRFVITTKEYDDDSE